ncbi:MAG TPA: hypothetical protein VHJ78_11485 [Actinomycetota bacterium]|nr:hypothetical protein [Actinomycetota bacterium]
MSEEQVREAVARYLEYLELGGREPDFTGLDAADRAQVEEILELLAETEGVGLNTADPARAAGYGTAPARTARHLAEASARDADRNLLWELDAWLPPGTPVDPDGAPSGFSLPDLPVDGAWVLGTVGGRVRVWRIDVAAAGQLETDTSHMETLDRVFRAFSDTAAICLVAGDLTCLLLEPQDCAPVIEVPQGGLAVRRYRRPVQRVGEALAAYIRELIPAWEALPRFEPATGRPVDVRTLATEAARTSVGAQAASGARARYPKKEVLTALGEREAAAVADLAIALFEGRRTPGDAEAELRRLAR